MALLLTAIIALFIISAPPLAIAAFRRSGQIEIQIRELRDRLAKLEAHLAGENAETASDLVIEPTTESPHASRAPTVTSTQPKTETSASTTHPRDALTQPEQAKPSRQRTADERTLTTKWMVWLGGVTIALGGVFLVKYGVEHGLISPALRVSLGLLLGGVLIGAGEWLRRRPLQHAIAQINDASVPQALTGAGICVSYGAIYAGYALFGMFAPSLAFAGLAVASLAALALSLLQGPFVAVLGVLGAFAVPLLIVTDSPSAWTLFGYLSAIVAASFAIVRYKDWWWLAVATVTSAVLWQLLGIDLAVDRAEIAPLAGFMVLTFAATLAARREAAFADNPRMKHPFDASRLTAVHALVIGSAAAFAAITVLLLMNFAHANGSLAVAAIAAAMFAACAYKARALESLFPLAAILSLALLATWYVPHHANFMGMTLFTTETIGSSTIPPAFSEFNRLAIASAVVAVVFAVSGFLGLRRAWRPDAVAAVSGFAPLAALAIAYWRLSSLAPDAVWSGMALGMGGAAVFAASQTMPSRGKPFLEAALGLYALAAVAAIVLAFAVLLETAWLTVALALVLPSMAWAHERFKIASLRPAAIVVAVAVLVRLVLLHQFSGSPFDVELDAGWILYSYGLPAASFAAAARLFRRTADDHLVITLESGAIATGVAMVNLEIRHLVGEGQLGFEGMTLLELSLHSMTWLASGVSLYWRQTRTSRPVIHAAARILLCAAAVGVFGGQVFLYNPWLTGAFVGATPIFNTLFLAYLTPAAAAFGIAYMAGWRRDQPVQILASAAALILAFVWLNMEVRNLFHDGYPSVGPTTDAEIYSYSIAWLALAAPLLVVGLAWRKAAVRHAGLALVLLTVLKVFLYDMAGLDGLYQAMSFLGLGLALVAIGYCYQRFFR